jgi:ATP-binding dynein motor region
VALCAKVLLVYTFACSAHVASLCLILHDNELYAPMYDCRAHTSQTHTQVSQARLLTVREGLAQAQGRSDRCKGAQARLRDDFELQLARKRTLEARAGASRRRSERATSLLTSLAPQKAQWTAEVRQRPEARRRLHGDCAAAAAFLCYCGSIGSSSSGSSGSSSSSTAAARAAFLQQACIADLVARAVPVTDGFDPVRFLYSDAPVRAARWHSEGLLSDPHSAQNAALVVHTVQRQQRAPLLIDPDRAGVRWLARHCGEKLSVVNFNDPARLLQLLEHCMVEAVPLLLEGVTAVLDAVLCPLLERRVVVQGRARYVQIGSKLCELSEGFELYLATQLAAPVYSAEDAAKVTRRLTSITVHAHYCYAIICNSC